MTLDYYVAEIAQMQRSLGSSFETTIKPQLKSFKCEKPSASIERFINSDTVYTYEKYGESRTYLICEEDTVNVLGFFAVGLSSFELPTDDDRYWEGMSRKVMKRHKSGIHDKQGVVGAYTIGELARRKGVGADALPGSVILKEALSQIRYAQEYAGGRFVLVDSRKTLYDRLYNCAGFRKLTVRESPNGEGEEDFIVSLHLLDTNGPSSSTDRHS